MQEKEGGFLPSSSFYRDGLSKTLRSRERGGIPSQFEFLQRWLQQDFEIRTD